MCVGGGALPCTTKCERLQFITRSAPPAKHPPSLDIQEPAKIFLKIPVGRITNTDYFDLKSSIMQVGAVKLPQVGGAKRGGDGSAESLDGVVCCVSAMWSEDSPTR